MAQPAAPNAIEQSERACDQDWHAHRRADSGHYRASGSSRARPRATARHHTRSTRFACPFTNQMQTLPPGAVPGYTHTTRSRRPTMADERSLLTRTSGSNGTTLPGTPSVPCTSAAAMPRVTSARATVSAVVARGVRTCSSNVGGRCGAGVGRLPGGTPAAVPSSNRCAGWCGWGHRKGAQPRWGAGGC